MTEVNKSEQLTQGYIDIYAENKNIDYLRKSEFTISPLFAT